MISGTFTAAAKVDFSKLGILPGLMEIVMAKGVCQARIQPQLVGQLASNLGFELTAVFGRQVLTIPKAVMESMMVRVYPVERKGKIIWYTVDELPYPVPREEAAVPFILENKR